MNIKALVIGLFLILIVAPASGMTLPLEEFLAKKIVEVNNLPDGYDDACLIMEQSFMIARMEEYSENGIAVSYLNVSGPMYFTYSILEQEGKMPIYIIMYGEDEPYYFVMLDTEDGVVSYNEIIEGTWDPQQFKMLIQKMAQFVPDENPCNKPKDKIRLKGGVLV
ncbi:hypothetical protein K9M79_05635 [Candidatus Woesearchaeota archaeon]|nr:hypothetical protein [Candidatus Woesearchaeota archaeon]